MDAGGRKKLVRAGVLVLVLLATFIVAHATGLTKDIGVDKIRTLIETAGPAGALAFVAAFAVGELLHVPGIVFVVAGVLGYGKVLGFPLCLVAALGSLTLSFVVVRAFGGRALADIERPFIRRMLAHLDERPIRTVALLRLVLFLMPALNYGLALTNIRYRDYLIGSALGILPQLVGATLFVDWVATVWLA